MPITPVPRLTDVPEFPALSDRAAGSYNSKAYAFGTHMSGPFNGEIQAVADSAYQNASHAESRAQAASASASVVAAAIEAAEFMTGLTLWTNRTYAKGEGAISQINGQTYIRLTAGGGSVDPANDTAGVWASRFGNGSFKPIAAATATFDLSTTNFFTRTVSGSETWVFDKCPTQGFSFTVEMRYVSGVVTFPSTVKTANNLVYSFTPGKTYELMFRTTNKGATRWRVSVTDPYDN